MRKLFLFISVLLGAIIAFSACSKKDTYADKLKKERSAIDRFIDSHDIKVLSVFPTDSLFLENEYFRDGNTGVYFRVIDWGEGDTIRMGTEAYLRVAANSIFLVGNDTIPYGNDWFNTYLDITYGIESTYTGSQYSLSGSWPLTQGDCEFLFLSPACVLPLKYHLRNGGIVSIITPFSSGSKAQQSNYEPLYLPEVKYTLYND